MSLLRLRTFLSQLLGLAIFTTTPPKALKVYTGSAWEAIGTPPLTEVDAGVFDSIAPYNGGDPTTALRHKA
jgi:hypothetical protein